MFHPEENTVGDTVGSCRTGSGCSSTGGSMRCRRATSGSRTASEITDEEYQKYFEHFDPGPLRPEGVGAGRRESAGMKYFVVTTKHHEGFCLWDSKLTDYKATNTPSARTCSADGRRRSATKG